jgi:hypothetical protein
MVPDWERNARARWFQSENVKGAPFRWKIYDDSRIIASETKNSYQTKPRVSGFVNKGFNLAV